MATTDNDMDKSDSNMRHEDTVSLVKSIITSEFRELKRDLSINNTSSKSSCLKRKYVDDAFVFTKLFLNFQLLYVHPIDKDILTLYNLKT